MANGADIPSHARLVLVLALFFEFFFSLGFYGPIPWLFTICSGQSHDDFKGICESYNGQLNIAMSEMSDMH